MASAPATDPHISYVDALAKLAEVGPIFMELETEPDAQTRFELAKAYADKGLLQDAMSELAIVLSMEPGHVGACAELAHVRSRLPRR